MGVRRLEDDVSAVYEMMGHLLTMQQMHIAEFRAVQARVSSVDRKIDATDARIEAIERHLDALTRYLSELLIRLDA